MSIQKNDARCVLIRSPAPCLPPGRQPAPQVHHITQEYALFHDGLGIVAGKEVRDAVKGHKTAGPVKCQRRRDFSCPQLQTMAGRGISRTDKFYQRPAVTASAPSGCHGQVLDLRHALAFPGHEGRTIPRVPDTGLSWLRSHPRQARAATRLSYDYGHVRYPYPLPALRFSIRSRGFSHPPVPRSPTFSHKKRMSSGGMPPVCAV